MVYYGTNDYRNYLAHHGILGMSWGDRNGPPYPLNGPAHSADEKKAGWRRSLGGGRNTSLYGRLKKGVADIKTSVKKKKKELEQKRNLKKARKAKERIRKEQAERERILKSGSAAEVLANKDKFTSKEINDVIDRVQTENRLRDIQTEEMLSKANQIQKVVNTVVGYGRTAISVYDTYTDIKNRMDKSKKAESDAKINKLIRTGDAEAILANKQRMDDQTLKNALSRLKTEREIQKFGNSVQSNAKKNKPSNQNNQTTTASTKPETRSKPEGGTKSEQTTSVNKTNSEPKVSLTERLSKQESSPYLDSRWKSKTSEESRRINNPSQAKTENFVNKFVSSMSSGATEVSPSASRYNREKAKTNWESNLPSKYSVSYKTAEDWTRKKLLKSMETYDNEESKSKYYYHRNKPNN